MLAPVHSYWHFKAELEEIYANIFLRSLGLSMVGIFVPIFFLQNGLSLTQVLLEYFGVMHVAALIANFLVVHLLRSVGIKHTITLSIPFLMAQLALLNLYSTHQIHHSLIGALGGIAISLYWMGLHTDFALASDKQKEGAESGVMYFVIRLASIFGPLTGGVILAAYSFQTLFLVSLALITFSAAPLLRTADIRKPEVVSWTSYIKMENAKYAVRFFAEGFRAIVEGILWPVLIFSVLKNFLDVGAAGSLAILGAAVFSAILGRVSDVTGSSRLLRLTALPMAILYYAMVSANTAFLILLVSLLIGIVSVGVDLPIYRSFIRHAKRNDVVGYILFRETILNVGKLMCLFIVAASANQLGTGFYLASLLSLLMAI